MQTKQHIIHFSAGFSKPSVNHFNKILCELSNIADVETLILLSSSGGDNAAAIHAGEMLKHFQPKAKIHNISVVNSAALLLYLASKTRTCSDYGNFLIHDTRAGLNNNYNSLKIQEAVSLIEAENSRFTNWVDNHIYNAQKSLDIRRYLTGELSKVINKTEALAYGIVTSADDINISQSQAAKHWFVEEPQ